MLELSYLAENPPPASFPSSSSTSPTAPAWKICYDTDAGNAKLVWGSCNLFGLLHVSTCSSSFNVAAGNNEGLNFPPLSVPGTALPLPLARRPASTLTTQRSCWRFDVTLALILAVQQSCGLCTAKCWLSLCDRSMCLTHFNVCIGVA